MHQVFSQKIIRPKNTKMSIVKLYKNPYWCIAHYQIKVQTWKSQKSWICTSIEIIARRQMYSDFQRQATTMKILGDSGHKTFQYLE